MEAQVKSAMIEHARAVVLLATSTKFHAHGLYVVARAKDVHEAYLTDPPSQAVDELRQAGVSIHLV